jgi:hypothetical protein
VLLHPRQLENQAFSLNFANSYPIVYGLPHQYDRWYYQKSALPSIGRKERTLGCGGVRSPTLAPNGRINGGCNLPGTSIKALRLHGMTAKTWILHHPVLLMIAVPAAALGMATSFLIVGPIVGVVVPATVRAVLGALLN